MTNQNYLAALKRLMELMGKEALEPHEHQELRALTARVEQRRLGHD